MVRKYSAYLKEGFKTSSTTMKRRGNRLKFHLFYLIKILSIIFPFFFPVVATAEIRLSKNSIKYNDIGVYDSFKEGAKPKKFWNIIIAYLLCFFTILAGLVVIFIITALFVLLGIAVGNLSDKMPINFIANVFSIPGIACAVVFITLILLYYSAIPYISETISDIDGYLIVKKSIDSMKKGKLIILFNTIIMALISFVTVGLPLLFLQLVLRLSPFALIIYVILVTLFFIAILIFAPIVFLGFINANTLLYEDIVLDDISEKKTVRGIVISKNKRELKNNLLNIFNRTQDTHFTTKNHIDDLSNDYDEDDEYDEEEDEKFENELEKEGFDELEEIEKELASMDALEEVEGDVTEETIEKNSEEVK